MAAPTLSPGAQKRFASLPAMPDPNAGDRDSVNHAHAIYYATRLGMMTGVSQSVPDLLDEAASRTQDWCKRERLRLAAQNLRDAIAAVEHKPDADPGAAEAS